MPSPAADRLIDILRQTTVALVRVRDESRDLSARQLAIFLICYLSKQKQTPRGLAADLRVPKSSITRALGRLETLGLARRLPDPADRRSMLVGRTAKGEAFLRDVSKIMVEADRSARGGANVSSKP
jgi:DNA-binding MarR family transcriptional regulator